MNIEQQVCSLELAKRLKELGVKQESLFYWTTAEQANEYCIYPSSPCFPCPRWRELNGIPKYDYSAFTVAELGLLLPKYFYSSNRDDDWVCTVFLENNNNKHSFAETEADARAYILIYLLEQGLLNAADISLIPAIKVLLKHAYSQETK